ncbi:MAG: FIST C-terminal domain-containing protein [Bacteroidota bacterium]
MKSTYVHAGDTNALQQAFQQLEADEQIRSVLFFMADKTHFSSEIVTSLVQQSSKKIIGGIFPELIFQGERKSTGAMFVFLEYELDCHLFDLRQNSTQFLNVLEQRFKDFGLGARSLFIFSDNLGTNSVAFIESLYNFFGINLKYMGGAAGSEAFTPFPCIIDNAGVHQNAAVIGVSNLNARLGVAHGLSAITEPLKVTEAVGTRIKTINWQPAFSLYKEIVEDHAGKVITISNFWDIVQFYPLGIARMDEERILRDLRNIDDTALVTVNPINQGEHVCIMNGDKNSLLEGAERAHDLASEKMAKSDQVFCINCVSRGTFLQEDFVKEIESVGERETVNGILTMGEIASTGYSMPEIFNKTIVVAKW